MSTTKNNLVYRLRINWDSEVRHRADWNKSRLPGGTGSGDVHNNGFVNAELCWPNYGEARTVTVLGMVEYLMHHPNRRGSDDELTLI